MKGIAALAACIPVIGTTKCVVEKAAPAGSTLPIDSPSGVQRHGDQPDFYIHSWSVEVETKMGRDSRHRRTGRDSIHLEVYAEHPADLMAWCATNPLTVKLPQVDKVYRIHAVEWTAYSTDLAGYAIISIDGNVTA